ncbi:pseudouridine synthase [Ottowia sp. SB7-C50]|uniref:pseudouridine synthase n=1 Tax=Ottowia sp. SB7-C50 TaxID=3081231 RepID=UPI0029542E8A|nr:pseudouridine synthase [Ottowia sp. SB7-C50]WOP14733.1 pseudouridine synthase [Ottowia sp. SB7-C50]
MLPILYQDDDLVAIDKPAGLLVHRTGLDAGETRFAVQLLHAQIGRPVWPVHRLDKGTSGVLLFALSAGAASAARSVFESNQVTKTYRAMVRGWPPPAGLIDHPLRRLPDDARASARALDVQPARTRFRTLAQLTLPLPYGDHAETRCALIELTPLTGRRHQLRRHCKHMAHPIVGDATHGKGPLNRALAGWLGLQRLWLHALSLELQHPLTGAPLRITAPPGNEWQRWPLPLP